MVIRLYYLHVLDRKFWMKMSFGCIEFHIDHILHSFEGFFAHRFWNEDFIGFVL